MIASQQNERRTRRERLVDSVGYRGKGFGHGLRKLQITKVVDRGCAEICAVFSPQV